MAVHIICESKRKNVGQVFSTVSILVWLSQELKSQLKEECEHFKRVIVAHQSTIEEKVTELGNCKVIDTHALFVYYLQFLIRFTNLFIFSLQTSMDDMSRSMAALGADKSNLEKRLAEEKVCWVHQ